MRTKDYLCHLCIVSSDFTTFKEGHVTFETHSKTTKNISRHCQMSPGEQNHLWLITIKQENSLTCVSVGKIVGALHQTLLSLGKSQEFRELCVGNHGQRFRNWGQRHIFLIFTQSQI